MAVTFRPLSPPTDEEMLALHALNPGYRVERLADGRLLVSPTGARGGVRNAELTDPYAPNIEVWRNGALTDLGAVAQLDCAPVMPNFLLDVEAIRST